MNNPDIRWKQRFSNYQKAVTQLTKFMQRPALNELEEQGLIQAFEYNHELAWKTLSDFLKQKGNMEIFGSKDATREAFKLNLIEDGEVWMEMVKSRNMTSETYNDDIRIHMVKVIKSRFYQEFISLEKQLNMVQKEENA